MQDNIFPLGNDFYVHFDKCDYTNRAMMALALGRELKDALPEIHDSINDQYNHMMVLDDFLVYGTKNNRGQNIIGIRPYDDELFIDMIDYNLSLLNRPIRIADRTREYDFKERLEPRINDDMYWLDYDTDTRLLKKRTI